MNSNLEYLNIIEKCKSILYNNDIKIYKISPTLDDSILIRFEINNRKYAFDFYKNGDIVFLDKHKHNYTVDIKFDEIEYLVCNLK